MCAEKRVIEWFEGCEHDHYTQTNRSKSNCTNAKMIFFFGWILNVHLCNRDQRIHAPRKTVLGAQVSFYLSNICLSCNVFWPVSILNSCSLTAADWRHQLAEHKVQIFISTYFTESDISLERNWNLECTNTRLCAHTLSHGSKKCALIVMTYKSDYCIHTSWHTTAESFDDTSI